MQNRPRRLARRFAALAGAALLAPAGAAAQTLSLVLPEGEALTSAVVSAGTPPSCLEALPPSAFRRAGVYLVADHAGAPFPRIPDAARVAVKLATESIAWRTRSLLGAPDGLLPAPDTLVNWRNVGRHLHVVGHPDGRITWSYPWDTPGHEPFRDSVGEVTLALMGRALDSALAHNERFAWPDGIAADSIPFLVRMDYPDIDPRGKLQKMRGMHAAVLLEIRAPMTTPVTPRRMGTIRYPEESRLGGVTANIELQFVVDSSGRPVEPSIRDLWPDDKPRPTGFLLEHYEAFLTEIKRGLAVSRYNPARVGGCAVPQLVQQPFTFDIR